MWTVGWGWVVGGGGGREEREVSGVGCPVSGIPGTTKSLHLTFNIT